MNRKFHSIILISFILVALISCGGGGGAPGSDFGDTSIMIKSALLSTTSPDIDTFRDCCAVDATTGACTTIETPNPFVRSDAVLSVTAENLTPNITSAHFPAKIQQCTVTYLKSNEDPASPIIETFTIYPGCILSEGVNTCNVTLMDISRKQQYALDVFGTVSDVIAGSGISHIPAQSPSHYVASMTCTYTNNFGKTGTFQSALDIWLADFFNCA
jgi:hypothetical protein